MISAVKKNTVWDYAANVFALWGISTPNFWLGIMLIFLFSVKLGWLPASGYVPLQEDWQASLASTIMPAFVLGNAIAGDPDAAHAKRNAASAGKRLRAHRPRQGAARAQDYPQTRPAQRAHADHYVWARSNSALLLSGAVLTEQIFTIPGFGKLIVDAVFNRDYAVVQGVVLVTATTFIFLNLLADIAYHLVNPRLRGMA